MIDLNDKDITINLLGHRFMVKSTNTKLIDNSMGMIEIPKNMIWLSEELSESMAVSTLLHEIIEHINYSFQLEMEHNVLQALEAGLYQILTDNGVNLETLLRFDEEG